MTKGWKEVANAFGFVLLFGIIAWNLWAGAGLFVALFRGVVAWLVFQILNIALTNLVVRTLSQYEYKRLREIAEEEEMEELRRAQEAADEDSDYEMESNSRPASSAASASQTASAPSSTSTARPQANTNAENEPPRTTPNERTPEPAENSEPKSAGDAE